MYRQSLNRAAREQSQSGNTAEHNPPAPLERQQREGQPSMNPVRERFPSRRQQENSQHGRPPNTSMSQHGQQMSGSYRHEDSTPVPCDWKKSHEEHLLRCTVCLKEAVTPTTIACGHTFCYTCLSQHCIDRQMSTLICPICLMPELNKGLYPDIESPFPLEHGWASPLIFAGPTGNITLNMDAVGKCFMSDTIRDVPVYLLSVVGEKRTGKSFLMNYIIRALRNQGKEFSLGGKNDTLKGFEWKPGDSGTTKGVWIWSEPFIVESNEKKMALFLLDTEGLMDIENDRNTSI
ncbi:RING finger protein 112 isoform X1 [Xenopus tropicalis]|uniref:RING finger protein 112 isoform X1 n=1 Tax=Xenopus tropicalis TaxID=8364 RepID=A0A8J1JBD3_XENTR|nr:RING finger protein 112 isoform X1 [Xenopus tropicalis]